MRLCVGLREDARHAESWAVIMEVSLFSLLLSSAVPKSSEPRGSHQAQCLAQGTFLKKMLSSRASHV